MHSSSINKLSQTYGIKPCRGGELMQTHVFGLEAVGLLLLLLYVMYMVENRALRSKTILSMVMAVLTTFVFVVNIGSVTVRDNRVTSMATFSFGLPARGFLINKSLDYTMMSQLEETRATLSFSCAVLDSTGHSGYGIKRGQNYYDLVVRPYNGSLKEFMTAALHERDIGTVLREFAANQDSTSLETIKRMVEEIGQPLGLHKIEKVSITLEGGEL